MHRREGILTLVKREYEESGRRPRAEGYLERMTGLEPAIFSLGS
jgi:hypothetical protein